MTNAATKDLPNRDWDRRGLPGWTYHNEAFLALEMEDLFKTHWQIVGHVNDVPKPGDFITFDLGPERAMVMRGDDGQCRAFHNLCRHRGSRVVAQQTGHCTNAIVCPFHGWIYNFDGTLRGPARPDSYPGMDKSQFGLMPIELDIWMGFLFIRFRHGSGKSVRELLQPYQAEFELHQTESLIPVGVPQFSEIDVNWKSVRDVDNEGYHVPIAHPALQDLYGFNYKDYSYGPGLSVAKGIFPPNSGRRWSVKNYTKLSQALAGLPVERHNLWSYYGLFPNNVFFLGPEAAYFYQELPISVGRSVVRTSVYRYPNENRQQKLARYLMARIDRDTFAEDRQLSIWSNESMKSSAFGNFHLSDLEMSVRRHHDQLRQVLPVVHLDTPPAASEMAQRNATMQQEMSVPGSDG
jgi:phenylpropionate dioxygenase-like ring-hydroxylating dioxygenase large terminal subunit